jgi:hypothetical protein
MDSHVHKANTNKTTVEDVWNEVIKGKNNATSEPVPEQPELQTPPEAPVPEQPEVQPTPEVPGDLPEEVIQETTSDETVTNEQTPPPVEGEDVVEEPKPLPEVIEDWDTNEPDEPQTPSVDWSEIRSQAEIDGEVNSQDELVSYVKNLKQELETVKTTSESYADLPEELKQAYEIAKSGGDYKGFLGVNDTSLDSADPITLYEDYVADYFKRPDNSFDEEGYEAFLDAKSDKEMEIEGMRIKAAKLQQRNAQVERYNAGVQAKAETDKASITKAVAELDKVGNFKVTDKHKAKLADGMRSGNLFKNLFTDASGNTDWGKAAKGLFILENFEQMNKYLVQRAKVNATRELTQELTNPQVTKPAASPTPKKADAPSSGMDLFLEESRKEAAARTKMRDFGIK